MDTDSRATQIERFYVHTRIGQVHARRLEATGSDTAPTLICLHPAPHSGLYFTTTMPALNEHRRVVAPDYPGYGGSSPPDEMPSMTDYAHSIIDLIDALGIPGDRPVDLLGFHTGCLVAVEAARLEPAAVRRLVLVDVPYFEGSEQVAMLDEAVRPTALPTRLDDLADNWDRNVTGRLDAMSLDRAFELFVEQLRAGTGAHRGFHAAFSYPCAERFGQCTTPARLIATGSALQAATHRAAGALPHAELRDRPDIGPAVFEKYAGAIADEALAWLGD